MRILNVLPSLDFRYGGPIRSTLDLSAKALGTALRSEVIGPGPLNLPDNPLPRTHIHVVGNGVTNPYVYTNGISKWFDQNIRSFDGVVIHGMWLHPNWAAYQACKSNGIPYACFPHGMLDPWAITAQGIVKALKKRVYWTLRERQIFDGAQGILFTSNREMVNAYDVYPRLQKTCNVIPYVVSSEITITEKPSSPELLQPAGIRIMLSLGRVHPKKNLPFLLEAWAKAQPPKEWRLLIAGPADPRYRTHLDQLVTRYELHDSVSFVGPVAGQDKGYLLHRADWFVLPSLQENFAIAVLEALYAGCPVVISDQVQICDMLHDETEVLPLSIDAWVEFLKVRMSDDKRREYLIRRDATEVRKNFNSDALASQWISALNSLFSGRE